MKFERVTRKLVVDALRDTPIVFLIGPRQSGKSTLVKSVAGLEHSAEVFTFDSLTVREQARRDPAGFLADHPGRIVIDEVQRVPDLIYEIKADVDRERRPGRFLLTGSSNPLRSKKVTEGLTGRVEIIELWPLSQAEIEGHANDLVDRMMLGEVPDIADATAGRAAWLDRAMRGGYPEAIRRDSAGRRRWFGNYVTTSLESDISDIADLRNRAELPRLLNRLAANSGQLVSWNRVSSDLGITDKTVATYTGLLEAIFLVHLVPAWRPRMVHRAVSAPKVVVSDSGLLCHLLGVDESRLARDDRLAGVVMETFVVSEIHKLTSVSESLPRIQHFRDRNGSEVDLVLETRNGDIAAVEIKAGMTIRGGDLKGLRSLRERCGENFKAGAVIYAGERTLKLEDRIWALPVSALWQS